MMPGARHWRFLSFSKRLNDGRLKKTLGNLENNYIGDSGLKVLLDSPHLDGIRELNLNNNNLSDEAVIALAQSPKLKDVVSLHLAANRITDRGARALAESKVLGKFEKPGFEFQPHRQRWSAGVGSVANDGSIGIPALGAEQDWIGRRQGPDRIRYVEKFNLSDFRILLIDNLSKVPAKTWHKF